jgi:hypothetical protein
MDVGPVEQERRAPTPALTRVPQLERTNGSGLPNAARGIRQ